MKKRGEFLLQRKVVVVDSVVRHEVFGNYRGRFSSVWSGVKGKKVVIIVPFLHRLQRSSEVK